MCHGYHISCVSYVRISLWWYSKLIIILYSSFFLNRFFSLIFFGLWVSFYVSMGIIKTSNTCLSEVPNWIPSFSPVLISQPPPFYCINKDKTKQSRVDKDNNIELAYQITSVFLVQWMPPTSVKNENVKNAFLRFASCTNKAFMIYLDI